MAELQSKFAICLFFIPQCSADCVIKVGMHAIYGVDAAYAAWNATFQDYLTAELYPTLNCSFMLVPLVGETAVYNAVGNATIDLVWSNAGMHSCLEV